MAKTETSADEKQEKKPEGQAQDKATDRAARKKRGRKNIAEGVVHIHSTFKNTIAAITDYQATSSHGQCRKWDSKARERTPFAPSGQPIVAKKAGSRITVCRFRAWSGRGARTGYALQSAGISISLIGCDPDSS
jgi:small subunit ribosomal protein S11